MNLHHERVKGSRISYLFTLQNDYVSSDIVFAFIVTNLFILL